MLDLPYAGETFALLAPLAWSFAVILFRVTGEDVPPVALNLFKNVVATILFALTLGGLVLLGSEGAVPVDVELWHYGLLLLSGLIGVGVADLFFFMCLNRIGAGRQAIVNTAYSPPIILLSWIFLGERMTGVQLLGVGAILAAVMFVGMTRQANGDSEPRVLVTGIFYGLVASLTQAVSIVMVKPFMDDWPLVWMTTWRMLGGLASAILMVSVMGRGTGMLGTLRKRSTWRVMLPATVLGSYASLLLWMAGFKYADASVAAALNQTATLFTFVLAVVLLHEPVTRRRLAGLVCGLVGVVLVTFFGAAS
jgi:drug/metabolite transporter (DMT)-like permease